MEKNKYIYDKLGEMFPNARCELRYNNNFELLIAVVLSSQTTDKKVNIITTDLFRKYPNPLSLSLANKSDVEIIIKPLGLSKTKSNNIINLSKILVLKYNSIVPNSKEDLISLPGVGEKTASVILAEGFSQKEIAVDTHVLRVSYRLRLTKEIKPNKVANDLKMLFDENVWDILHLRLLFFGRYFCTAKKPKCNKCPFIKYCIEKNP